MPKFLTIGYGDQDGYDRISQPSRDAAHAHDEQLVATGAVMGIAGKPVLVRNPAASGVEVTEGQFLSSDLPVAGFAIIEADSLEEAIEMVSRVPCAIAYGVVEVWPLETASGD
ncbi:YciI family protein [Szabonella alba]|uniref:YCII-related domain-containing protein n=1 Tax=Szabonella alba TaxID=2804194 RepID=A0A8K0Y0C6_9RHOB|nr:YciI family protein [Szabonella alba]MBL4918045.1 hypothetical protein [Szabonella alba]